MCSWMTELNLQRAVGGTNQDRGRSGGPAVHKLCWRSTANFDGSRKRDLFAYSNECVLYWVAFSQCFYDNLIEARQLRGQHTRYAWLARMMIQPPKEPGPREHTAQLTKTRTPFRVQSRRREEPVVCNVHICSRGLEELGLEPFGAP